MGYEICGEDCYEDSSDVRDGEACRECCKCCIFPIWYPLILILEPMIIIIIVYTIFFDKISVLIINQLLNLVSKKGKFLSIFQINPFKYFKDSIWIIIKYKGRNLIAMTFWYLINILLGILAKIWWI